jgi:chemotaxis response regulator CheB
VGVILTGMGDDGVSGLIAISVVGGITLAQSPEEAPHPSMPRNAIARDHVDAVLPVTEMPGVLAALVEGRPVSLGAPTPA